jgi:hypothetical protein
MCRFKSFGYALMLVVALTAGIAIPISRSSQIQFPWNIDPLTLTTQNSTMKSYDCIHTNQIGESVQTRCFDLYVQFDHCRVLADSSQASPLLLRQEVNQLYGIGSKHPADQFSGECLFNLDRANGNAVTLWMTIGMGGGVLLALFSILFELYFRRQQRLRLARSGELPYRSLGI